MKTTQAVIGKWPNVLSMLGVNAEYLSGKHTTCPICTNGKDKFRFDNKEGRGTYFCNDCGAGDGWKLLNLIHGWEFKEAANQIDKVLHKATDSPVKATENLKTTRARLRQIQRRIEPLNESGNVYKYLSNRDICRDVIGSISDQLNFVPGLEYYENGRVSAKFDAMVATVKMEGEPVSYHVTYLNNGNKAEVSAVRKFMSPTKPMKGAAVELFKHKEVLGVSEGIETALSCTQLFEIPTWATLNANNLAAFKVPEDVKHLMIFGDNDVSYTGQKAAFTLAWQAHRKGIKATVHIPVTANTDWNDQLRE